LIAVTNGASSSTTPENTIDIGHSRRFGGLVRLYGEVGFARIRAAHAVIVGIGGVGSWAAEALARSGIGRITLIDMDVVAESNLNRQAHATIANLGRNKVDAMRERILSFAPDCAVDVIDDFVSTDNVTTILPPSATFVIDAIDKVNAKAGLVAHCKALGLPIYVCGGSGGKTDVTQLVTSDLAFTEHDALLAKLRLTLRRQYGFPRGDKKFKIAVIYCSQRQSEAPEDSGAGLNCAGYGSAMHMTASMGLMAAGSALRTLVAQPT
jgi:tRNA threonylcarbamoyladenosine dehydratase